jgi:hypothetical protein
MPITTANVSTTTSAVYTSSGNTAITWLSICNYGAGNITANVHVVPNGASANSINKVLSSIDILVGDTYQLYSGGEKLLLGNGDTVQINASGNSSVGAVTSYTSI